VDVAWRAEYTAVSVCCGELTEVVRTGGGGTFQYDAIVLKVCGGNIIAVGRGAMCFIC
jgi:hypothetical protein